MEFIVQMFKFIQELFESWLETARRVHVRKLTEYILRVLYSVCLYTVCVCKQYKWVYMVGR